MILFPAQYIVDMHAPLKKKGSLTTPPILFDARRTTNSVGGSDGDSGPPMVGSIGFSFCFFGSSSYLVVV